MLNQLEDENPINLIKNFLHELENNIEKSTSGQKAKIVNEWTKNSETIHKNVIINTLNGKISGVAKKIEVDGSLIVKTRNGIKKIFVGDVIVK